MKRFVIHFCFIQQHHRIWPWFLHPGTEIMIRDIKVQYREETEFSYFSRMNFIAFKQKNGTEYIFLDVMPILKAAEIHRFQTKFLVFCLLSETLNEHDSWYEFWFEFFWANTCPGDDTVWKGIAVEISFNNRHGLRDFTRIVNGNQAPRIIRYIYTCTQRAFWFYAVKIFEYLPHDIRYIKIFFETLIFLE